MSERSRESKDGRSSANDARPRRQLVIFLHAHLPYCRREDLPASLEETWLFEALTECYLPLVRMLDRLVAARVAPGLTLSLSPVLVALMRNGGLLARYRRRLEQTEALARRDAHRGHQSQRYNAGWHAGFFAEARRTLDVRCGGDLPGTLREFHTAGVIELATTAATHGFFPAYQNSPDIIRAQVGTGIDEFARVFGFRPRFFWLPECGYFPGVDEILAECGVEACAVEEHGILQARPPPPEARLPVMCPSGVKVVGRDTALSRLVWSAQSGYPGDQNYREFHRDRVHELSTEEVATWLDGSRARLPSGLKYWRVTGPGDDKDWYRPVAGSARAQEHARDFVARAVGNGGTGMRFVPFDAELFGHWWFEGIEWLEHVLRLIHDSPAIEASTVSPALAAAGGVHRAIPAVSTWGHRGDNSFWVTHDNAWIYPQILVAARRLATLVAAAGDQSPDGSHLRALRQAARTFLLAQASDWPFMISTGTVADLATAQVTRLLADLDWLLQALEMKRIDEQRLRCLEERDAVFPEVDLSYFRGR